MLLWPCRSATTLAHSLRSRFEACPGGVKQMTNKTHAAPRGAEKKRNRGRPHSEHPRRQIVKVRLTGSEKADLMMRAGRLGMAELLRSSALRHHVSLVPTINRAAWVELARSAANINQLAHHANGGGILGGAAVRPILEKISQQIADLRMLLIAAAPIDDGDLS